MNLPKNVSESTRRRNPDLYPVAGLRPAVRKQTDRPALERCQTQPLQGAHGIKSSNGPRWLVAITCYRAKTLDSDNLVAGCKALRDSIAEWLGCDDSDRVVRWEYHQVKSEMKGTSVVIKDLR